MVSPYRSIGCGKPCHARKMPKAAAKRKCGLRIGFIRQSDLGAAAFRRETIVWPSWPLGPGNNVAEAAHPPPRKVPGDFYGCLILSDFAAIYGCGIPRNPGWVKKTGTISNLVGSGLTGA